MFKPNTSYKKLKDTYLFNTIYRKTNEYLTANPDKKVLQMGVGDVSLPLCDAVIEAFHDQANAATFNGYMSEIGAAELRHAIEGYRAGISRICGYKYSCRQKNLELVSNVFDLEHHNIQGIYHANDKASVKMDNLRSG
ncbi:diaminopimelate aminotransferase [Bacteroides caecimuris]|jgi:bifunctional pyridoxal-dependent enzyme with beta-cystathionase and maltose regulon repressor activities|uniref:diaminopimelate aminotransferase n=1 Tax=Bacteroides caecimuris TaxID=1796613 RepID=UPI0003412AD7|nr:MULTISPECIES: diaminopimelate aminotransferase [Bacteroides]EOS29518.1 LL-diaminopimelate aminotransferase [Lachnospiraceae bacterium 28-4]